MLLKKVVKFVGESYTNILENVLTDIFKIIWLFFLNNFPGDPSLKLVKKNHAISACEILKTKIWFL